MLTIVYLSPEAWFRLRHYTDCKILKLFGLLKFMEMFQKSWRFWTCLYNMNLKVCFLFCTIILCNVLNTKSMNFQNYFFFEDKERFEFESVWKRRNISDKTKEENFIIFLLSVVTKTFDFYQQNFLFIAKAQFPPSAN